MMRLQQTKDNILMSSKKKALGDVKNTIMGTPNLHLKQNIPAGSEIKIACELMNKNGDFNRNISSLMGNKPKYDLSKIDYSDCTPHDCCASNGNDFLTNFWSVSKFKVFQEVEEEEPQEIDVPFTSIHKFPTKDQEVTTEQLDRPSADISFGEFEF